MSYIPKITGTTAPVQQPTRTIYDPKTGLRIIETWESAGNNCGAQASAYAAIGVQYDLTSSSHKSTLTAEYTGAEGGGQETGIVTDHWQLQANEIQKDIFEHPTSLKIEEIYPNTLGRIRDDVERYNTRQAPGSPAPDPAAIALGGGLLFDLAKRGTTHYSLSQYVLRHTSVVPSLYAENVADANVGKVYTWAQLDAEVSTGWTVNCPARLQYKMQQLSANGPEGRAGYLWGWLKKGSTESDAANNMIEITTEYWLEQWATYLYPPVT